MKMTKSNEKDVVKKNKLSNENLKDKLLFGDGTSSKNETAENEDEDEYDEGDLDKEFALLEGIEGMLV